MDFERFEKEGFAICEALFDLGEVESWLPALETFREEAGGGHSVRNLVELPLVREIAKSPAISEIVQSAFLVRAILFDKVSGANWSVPWHQDLTIAVEARHDVDGYGPWSVKDGVPHVRPPASVLERMITVRIHLDPCGLENGPVRVIPGSHRVGIIPESKITDFLGEEATCTGAPGSALIMRPLILHASSPASSPHHRRVLHLEFADTHLPSPLCWHTLR